MKNWKAKRAWGFPAILVVFAAASVVVMLLWNWIIPAVTGWGTLTFWHAAGLIILSRILLSGFGRGGFHGHRPHGHHHHGHWRRSGGCGPDRDQYGSQFPDMEKMHNMSRSERKEYIRRHMAGFGHGLGRRENHNDQVPGEENTSAQ